MNEASLTRTPPTTDFVGREPEMRALLAGLGQAQAGRGRLFLVGGEPGIGKSRLADELAAAARAEGALVLWGRCWDGGGAPAYWPWVQCLRSYLRTQDESVARRQLVAGAPHIAQILPEVAALFPELPAPPDLDPEAARFQLFDATADFLRQAAHEALLVIVIDDLQAADTPSVLLLRFLASQLAESRALLLATYRDVELTPAHPLTAAIAEMGREPRTSHLQLRGLGLHDVALLAERRSGAAPAPELVNELHRQTGGNPLFVAEAMNLLLAEGGLLEGAGGTSLRLAIPGAVREVITRRLDLLSEQCREALSLASVLGPEVQTELLRRLAGVPLEQLLDLLDEATASGLLVEQGTGLGRYRFSHDLVREVLYDELGSARRARLHLSAGEELEALQAGDPDRHLAEIAHHFHEAGPAADVARTSRYAARAAAHAARQLAYEEAVRLYRMALQAVELQETADEANRVELMLELGDAQMRAGETARARETLLGAAAAARRLGLAEQLARAALGYGGRFVWARAANDRHVVRLLEDALELLGDRDTLLRARVLARLAGALRDQPDPKRREELSRLAVAMARRLGDPATLAYALDGRYSAIWAPDTVDERVAISDEIVQIAARTGDNERLFQGHHYRLAIMLERGDIPAARVQLEGNSRLAEELRQPAQRWYVRATTATIYLLEGRYAAAEGLINEAFEAGRHAESMHAVGVVRLQQYALRREQGRLAELEDVLRGSVEEYAFWPWMRVALLHLYVELDRRGDARSLLESVAGQDFADLPWDNDWLMGMSLLAEAVGYLRDADRAARLYQLLLPYGRRNGYGHPEFCTGSLARPLGILAGLLGRRAEALQHFDEALAMNERMGAWPWVAHTQHQYAAMLLAGRQTDDIERAAELLDAAAAISERLGMSSLHGRVARLRSDSLAAQAQPTAEVAGGTIGSRVSTFAEQAVFRREGEYWTISYAGDNFRMHDAKGLHYLARLLAHPGRELLALDLVQAGVRQRAAAQRQPELRESASADTAAQLDRQAKAEYRQRLHELQQELDEAETWNDAERADRLRSEMDFLARELSRAVGLGGRDRQTGSASERARLSVTRAIRAAMSRIGQHSPALGEHLELTVHTGTYCAYRPDPRASVDWQL